MTRHWIEVGERVFVRRYAFLDQSIGAIVGRDGVLLVDSRASRLQADELRRDLRELTRLPVTAVVNTHGHSDHAFGNVAFRPAPVWAHAGCPRFLVRTAADQGAWLRETFPERAAEFGDEPPHLPDRLFADRATIDLDGRFIELRHLGRGHTDHDVVVIVPDAMVVFAGDLVENGAPPAFEDAWPMDWPGTVLRLAELLAPDPAAWAVVPGHGDPAGHQLVLDQGHVIDDVAGLARRIHAGELDLESAVPLVPSMPPAARVAIERGVAQLRGELGA